MNTCILNVRDYHTVSQASAVLHGMLKQMAAFIYPGCGRLAAAVAAGMQASAIPVLIVSLISGFGRDESSSGIQLFYFSVAFLLLYSWGCFQIIVTRSPSVNASMRTRDSFLSEISSVESESESRPILENETNQEVEEFVDNDFIIPETDSSQEEYVDNEAITSEAIYQEELSSWKLLKKSQSACFVMIMTIASSMSVASCLNRVQSQNPSNEAFPQVLFYTRLIADLLSRPATLYRTHQSDSMSKLVLVAILRLGFVPIFFLYILNHDIPKNDVAAVIGIFIFAFTSGYLATSSYQIAPLLLDEQERELNSSRQTGLINVCFSASILLGFALTFVIDLESARSYGLHQWLMVGLLV